MRHHSFAAAVLSLLALPATAAITGIVMTNDGQPVAGIRASIFASESSEARMTRLLSASPDRVPLATVQTDAKGNFSLPSPKEPVVDLRIEGRGYEPESRRVESDEDTGAIVLTKREMRSGTITAGGKPVPNATVVVSYGGAQYVAKTDEQGRYEAPDLKRATSIHVIHHDYAIDEPALLTGPPAPAALNRTLSPGVAISGKVVSADGKTPVAKATVYVNNWPLAASGDDGTFTIAHAPAKWTSLSARSGAMSAQRAYAADKTFTLKLEKSATISGRITDTKSKLPVAGASVALVTGRGMMMVITGDGLSAMTDAKGVYSIPAPAGQYMLLLSHPAFEAQNAQVSVTTAQQLSRDYSMAQLARASGVVVDEEKRPVVAASIAPEAAGTDMRSFMPMRFMQSQRNVVSGPDGRFSIRMQPDSDLRLRATKKGLPQTRSDALHLAAGERKSGIVLTIPSGVAVSGRITDADGKGISGVAVTTAEATDGGGRGGVMRRIFTTGMQREDDDTTVTTASDGTFTMRLKEGTYDFGFKREGYAPKTMRAQNVAASGTNRIETTLDPAVEITGRVSRGGVGVPDVMINVIGEGSNMIMTGPDGSFTIGGLAAGPVRVMFMKDAEFIQENRNLTAPARDVAIDVPAGGFIAGRVVEKGTRKPITSFQAGISLSGGGGGMMIMRPPQLQSFTSDDGSFRLEHIPAGSVNLVANAPGYTSTRMTVDVAEGKTVSDVVLELDAGVRLTGKITGPNGSPLSDARVNVAISPTGGFARTGAQRNAVTDANGEYSLDSLEPGEETIEISHPKYIGTSRTVTLKGREVRLDVQLSGGQRVTGVVVTESGMPVPDADIEAFSAGGSPRGARSNANGSFEFESLAPARYRFTASKQGYLEGSEDDVDVSAGAPLRLVLRTGGTIYGHVTGLSETELSSATVEARSGRAYASSVVDPSGNYRLEGAPVGTVQVSASVMSRSLIGRRSSASQTVEMQAGGSQQVNLDFNSDTVIRGRVTRNGAPMSSATVQFFPRGGAGTTGSAYVSTDDQGNYSASGLEAGEYNVLVADMQRFSSYSTTYTVRGSATFDIDYKAARVRGHVIDALTNEPVTDASVSFRSASGGPQEMFRGTRAALSDANGDFMLDYVSPGSYAVTASREGYGNVMQEISITEAGRDDLELKLQRADGVTLRVIDGRDGRGLNARVTVFDMQGRVAWDNSTIFRIGASDDIAPLSIPVSPGSYVATVTAQGYAPRTTSFTSPSSPTVALTPGGTILVQSKHAEPRRVRLIDASGMPYPRMSTRSGTTMLPPGALPMENVAPGAYTLQLLDADESVAATVQVVVREGETVRAEI